MKPSASTLKLSRPARRVPWLLGVLTLLVFGVTLGLVTLQLRRQIRTQILNRDAESLHAVATLICAEIATENSRTVLDEDGLFRALLKASRLKGVIAARLFDSRGKFVSSFPINAQDGTLTTDDLAPLRSARPVSHFIAAAKLDSVLYPDPKSPLPAQAVPLLEANVPLQTAASASVQGFAQFIITGESLATEFTRLDRNLLGQAAVAYLAGSGVICLALLWAFRRLERANAELSRRTTSLLRANQELALSAKSAALGAVTAHLIHGLKNPLFGLQALVQENRDDTKPGETAWREAADVTGRMQEMVNDVVRLLREDENSARYEISLEELAVVLGTRVRPLATQRGVEVSVQVPAEGALDNRAANLISLVLVNLLQNAIQASPHEAKVTLRIANDGGGAICRVSDRGGGIPPEHQASLFMPGPSTKPGGTGLGLAISRQLALAIGCELFLEKTSSAGTVFALRIPAEVFAPDAGSDQSAEQRA